MQSRCIDTYLRVWHQRTSAEHCTSVTVVTPRALTALLLCYTQKPGPAPNLRADPHRNTALPLVTDLSSLFAAFSSPCTPGGQTRRGAVQWQASCPIDAPPWRFPSLRPLHSRTPAGYVRSPRGASPEPSMRPLVQPARARPQVRCDAFSDPGLARLPKRGSAEQWGPQRCSRVQVARPFSTARSRELRDSPRRQFPAAQAPASSADRLFPPGMGASCQIRTPSPMMRTRRLIARDCLAGVAELTRGDLHRKGSSGAQLTTPDWKYWCRAVEHSQDPRRLAGLSAASWQGTSPLGRTQRAVASRLRETHADDAKGASWPPPTLRRSRILHLHKVTGPCARHPPAYRASKYTAAFISNNGRDRV